MARRRLVPPTGFYDPALDAQRRQAQSGYRYLQQDTELAGARAGQDYGFGLEDLTRGRDRGYADLDTTLRRGREDYVRGREGLQRSYGQLARRQAEGARAAGVTSGGLALKAAAIRSANRGLEQRQLDTGFRRLGEDVGVQRSRLGEDFNTGRGRLDVDFNRGTTDRATALARGGEQNTQFGLDIDAQKLFQATQAGWIPPQMKGTPMGKFGGGQQGPGAAAMRPPVASSPAFQAYLKRRGKLGFGRR